MPTQDWSFRQAQDDVCFFEKLQVLFHQKFRTEKLDYSGLTTEDFNWEYAYGDIQEDIPGGVPVKIKSPGSSVKIIER